MPPARRACRKTPSRRRPGWRQAASRPLPREHPEERHLTLRLLHPDELVEDQLESRVANELTVRRGVEGREEHVDTEPLIGPIGAPYVAERGEEQPVRLQPACDPREQASLLLSGDVHDRVEGGDSVERIRGEVEPAEIAGEERCPGEPRASETKLPLGDVDGE